MVLQLELRHYETVLAIVELGTMTAAAKALSTSQSALSHRLAEAERRLGTTLFERGPQRRLKPTRAGVVIHQAASRALADLERSEALLLSEETLGTSGNSRNSRRRFGPWRPPLLVQRATALRFVRGRPELDSLLDG
jgi:DNA-binding transcriptional LysR family regulator